MNKVFLKKTIRTVSVLVLLALLLVPIISYAEGIVSVDSIVGTWSDDIVAPEKIQDPLAMTRENVIVPEIDALRTGIEAILFFESIDIDQLFGYRGYVSYNEVGSYFFYEVRLNPDETADAKPYYLVEVRADEPNALMFYHILNEEGTESISVKYIRPIDQKIIEQTYDEFMKDRKHG